MKVYLAGPMRNYPDFNFPAFDDAATKLRLAGFEVFNPCDRDRRAHGPDVNKSATGDLADVPKFKLREALGEDLAWICAEAEAVVVLPGWEQSKGASAEVATAKALGLPVYTLAEALGEKLPDDSPRVASLKRAIGYISGDRNASYGPPTQDFARTAAMWTAFGFRFVQHDGGEPQPIKAHQIANALILLKQSRLAWQPEKADSWDDTSGYAGCGHECAVEEAAAAKATAEWLARNLSTSNREVD